MDSSAAGRMDGFGDGGGGGDSMCDLFVGVDGESEELVFSWGADVVSRTTGLGDRDHDRAVLSCPHLGNGNATTQRMEDLLPGCVGTNVAKPCIAMNNRPPLVVNNFKDHVSSSRPTRVVSPPLNNDRGHVHVEMKRKPSRRDVTRVIRVAPDSEEQKTKKRDRWTVDEHRLFLKGRERLGNSWSKISQQYIPWKTANQLASHSQKYFIRQKTPAKNWIRNTVNNISEKDLISEDDSHSSPKQQPPLVSASLPGGGPSTAQQSLCASMSQTSFDGLSSMPLPAHDFIRFSSPVGEPAPAQQSFGGVSMHGANIGGPVLHRTVIGNQSSSSLQPFHNLGMTQWNYHNPIVYQEVVPWNQMLQLVAASSGYNSPAPPMLLNDGIDLEPPEQHPSSDEEGSHDFDWVPSDYPGNYWRNP